VSWIGTEDVIVAGVAFQLRSTAEAVDYRPGATISFKASLTRSSYGTDLENPAQAASSPDVHLTGGLTEVCVHYTRGWPPGRILWGPCGCGVNPVSRPTKRRAPDGGISESGAVRARSGDNLTAVPLPGCRMRVLRSAERGSNTSGFQTINTHGNNRTYRVMQCIHLASPGRTLTATCRALPGWACTPCT